MSGLRNVDSGGDVLRLSEVHAGQRVLDLVPGQVVTITGITALSGGAVDIYYLDQAGGQGAKVVLGEKMVRLASGRAHTLSFDGDAGKFKMAAEALRIKYAALYDPMAAVNSSAVDPLPHQIKAVYGELLPRVPLRFLLADDPGAGKTIMAGLFIKELVLRSACDRVIIVAPGGLVEQWRDELLEKFDLRFEIFDRSMMDNAPGKNPFEEHPFLIVRMDQIARNEELLRDLEAVSWDVAIVDEAHRMSAHYEDWTGQVRETKRFKLGLALSESAQHFLLMTATPHAGKEEDFQLFMSLLDQDRFSGQFREGAHRTDTEGLMRRMVKEDLLTFDGKPLFPERRASTVTYKLSPAESHLYDEVTTYVREEMGRAEKIIDKKRGNNVGFALTILQRRLASSPEAIYRSLERRRNRLETRLQELESLGPRSREVLSHITDDLPSLSIEDYDDEFGERDKLDDEAETIVDLATASQTIPELKAEIARLDDLVSIAASVRSLGADSKWVQLREILNEEVLGKTTNNKARKIIIFTEHRDTLEYLERQIATLLGKDAILTIHGGASRDERRAAQESFTNDPNVLVLLATDAAGEGLNLQRAHLMVNYDLPWNPNRIEQRFGRIHRIGQREVCHLWNLVAADTREGDVFIRLLEKIGNMSAAYDGNLFNVLGQGYAFDERSLKDLLIEAIKYGDDPRTKERLDQVIDAGVSKGVHELLENHGLERSLMSQVDVEAIRAEMDRARERRLQPGFIANFFLTAFAAVGGRARHREKGRYEITRVPRSLLVEARHQNRLAPVSDRYERVTFETGRIENEKGVDATLIALGNPLLNSLIEVVIDQFGKNLSKGAVLVDRRDNPVSGPVLIYIVEQEIVTNSGTVVSHHFDYVILDENRATTVTQVPPFLDFDVPNEDELDQIAAAVSSAWAQKDHVPEIKGAAFNDGTLKRLAELTRRRNAELDHTKTEVDERLRAEINHWANEEMRLREQERSGTFTRKRAVDAAKNVANYQERLESRLEEIEQSRELSPQPATIRGVALVLPAESVAPDDAPRPTFSLNTEETERRAVDAVLDAERRLGREPEELPHNNPGFDVRSCQIDAPSLFIEVKGRMEGAETFTVTANEINFAHTHRAHHRLALVRVSSRGPEYDEVRYLGEAFDHIEPAASTRSLNEKWSDYWDKGREPY